MVYTMKQKREIKDDCKSFGLGDWKMELHYRDGDAWGGDGRTDWDEREDSV